MRVLVTGATGNLGRALMAYAHEHSVEAVGTSRYGRDGSVALNLSRWGAATYLLIKQAPFDLVVMTHGIGNVTLVGNMTPAVWHTVIDTNLTSCVALTQALLEWKKLNPGALVIYCSSIQANTPRAGRAAYAVSKVGLETLCKVVAAELAPHGRAIALRLGQMEKTMSNIVFSESERQVLEQRAYRPWLPVQEVAELCWDLYKQSSLTATVIEVDSGQGRNVW